METPALPSQPASERELESLVPGYILSSSSRELEPSTSGHVTWRRGEEGTALQSLKGPSVHKGHPSCRVRSSPGQNLPAAEYLEAGDPARGPTQQRVVCLQAHLWHPKVRASAQFSMTLLPFALSRMGAEWRPKPLSFPNSPKLADPRQLLCQSHYPRTSPTCLPH